MAFGEKVLPFNRVKIVRFLFNERRI